VLNIFDANLNERFFRLGIFLFKAIFKNNTHQLSQYLRKY